MTGFAHIAAAKQRRRLPELTPKEVSEHPRASRWIGFPRPGEVEIYSGKVELGQGIETVLAQVAAQALCVSVGRIKLICGDTDRSPNEWYTAGSQSVEQSASALLTACVAVRDAAIDAAAKLVTNIANESANLVIADGAVLADGMPTGFCYWSLPGFHIRDVVVTPSTAPWSAFHDESAADASERHDFAGKVGGGFIQDLKPSGLVHARMIRPPAPGARPRLFDEQALRDMPGFSGIVINGGFVAVTAESEWQAIRIARRAQTLIGWEGGMAVEPFDDAVAWLSGAPAEIRQLRSSLSSCKAAPDLSWQGRFSRQPLLHASIGPCCALAQDLDGRLTVWTHSQGVFQLRSALAKLLRRDEASIHVIHVAGAGCYGHNGADDAACDAALIATQRGDGRPVRVQWSREEEFGQAPLGPPMITEIDASLDPSGRIAQWSLVVTSAPHGRRPGFQGDVNLLGGAELAEAVPIAFPRPVPAEIGGGAERNGEAIYDIAEQAMTHRFVPAFPLRTSSLRALGAHLNVVAIEGAMDELAALAGVDPVVFRLNHLSDPRARAVVERAAHLGGWDEDEGRATGIGSGRAKGFAFARYKNKAGFMAIVVEVEVDEEVRLLRADAVVDCGLAVNPDGVVNQVEGGILQAASFTLFEAVRIGQGSNITASWEDYPILGFRNVPPIRVELVAAKGCPPLGVGEVATGPASAAIVNAASRALGLRLRDLPITRQRIIDSLNAL